MALTKSVITPGNIIQRSKALQQNWTVRARKFRDWYDILLLEDVLEQEGMESVATNDPRTGYNLARHLLTTMTIADKIPTDELPVESIPAVSYHEGFVARRWMEQEKRYRSLGRQGFLNSMISWLLVTGWYSIFSMVTEKTIWAEVWSPAECFPDFGPDGLVEHARIYDMTAASANKKIKQLNWSVNRPFTDWTRVYDHWGFDSDGDVFHSIVMGSEFVKKPVKDPMMSKLDKLPIFTSPAGGLPDMGSIRGNVEGNLTLNAKWQEHFGESMLATNEGINANYNRMRSFYQQAARQTAQHHWLETSAGTTQIATDELMNRWGSVLHGAPGEDVRAIQPPAMPVELTSILLTYRNEIQRGSFPDSVFGNIQQQISFLAAANAAASSMQTLTPYLQAYKGMRTDVDNFWADMLIINKLRPHKYQAQENMPERDDRLFDVDVDVDIPGFLIQRATVARMLNPDFTLPESLVMDKLFPEIRNPLLAQAQVRKEKAFKNEKAVMVDQIIAYRKQAELFRNTNDIDSAKLYEKLANSLEAELDAATQPGAGGPPGAGPAGRSPVPREIAEEVGLQ